MKNKTNNRKHFLMGMLQLVKVIPDGKLQSGLVAYTVQSFNVVGEVGNELATAKLPVYASMGYYFKGIATLKAGAGNKEEAGNCFDQALAFGPHPFEGRIIIAKTQPGFYEGDNSAQASACESLLNSPDPFAAFEARRGLAVAYGSDGQHVKALTILEGRPQPPKDSVLYCWWMNSLAVELLALDRIEQALEAITAALSSPYAKFYPEIGDTAREIEEKAYRPAQAFIPRIQLVPEVDRANLLRRAARVAEITRLIYDKTYSEGALAAGVTAIKRHGK